MPWSAARIDDTQALLARQRAEVEAALGDATAADPAWCVRSALIRSMPGAGAGRPDLLIAQLPEPAG